MLASGGKYGPNIVSATPTVEGRSTGGSSKANPPPFLCSSGDQVIYVGVYNTLEDAARAADWTVHEQQWVSTWQRVQRLLLLLLCGGTVLLWVGLTMTWLFSFAFFLLLLLVLLRLLRLFLFLFPQPKRLLNFPDDAQSSTKPERHTRHKRNDALGQNSDNSPNNKRRKTSKNQNKTGCVGMSFFLWTHVSASKYRSSPDIAWITLEGVLTQTYLVFYSCSQCLF